MGITATLVMLAMAQSVAPAAPADPPVSLERIHEGLQRPKLKIPPLEITPVFRASVVDAPLDNPSARGGPAPKERFGRKSSRR